jgi:hypothetical protein
VRNPQGISSGVIQSFSESIFSLTDIRRSLEARALSLGQFSGDRLSIATRASYPSFAAVVVSFRTACCRSIRACADLSTSSDHGYFILVALYSSDDP